VLAADADGRVPDRSLRTASRREQALEVGVFLLLIVPSLVLSFVASARSSVSFALLAASTIARDVALVALVAFFLWRNGEPFARLGWRWQHFWREAAIGAALFVPFFFVSGLVDALLTRIGLSSPPPPQPFAIPRNQPLEVLLALLLVAVVAFSEETVFRGYLILRFRAVLGSVAGSLLLSAFVFSLGHGYEGPAGVVTVGFMGLVFALLYWWRRSMVAPMTVHFLQDLLAIIVLPLLR
jgi:uncharacterized protein